jgi:hypothetical protein
MCGHRLIVANLPADLPVVKRGFDRNDFRVVLPRIQIRPGACVGANRHHGDTAENQCG